MITLNGTTRKRPAEKLTNTTVSAMIDFSQPQKSVQIKIEGINPNIAFTLREMELDSLFS